MNESTPRGLPAIQAVSAGEPSTTAFSLGRGLTDLCAVLRGDHEVLRDTGGPDWPRVVEAAVQHGMGPILMRRGRFVEREWPMAALQKALLLFSWHDSTRACARLLGSSRVLIRALDSAGIPSIALKGLHLALAYYDDPVLRPMGDIDLLISEKHLDKAYHTVTGMGYSPLLVPASSAYAHRHHHLPPLLRDDSPPVELHHCLTSTSRSLVIDTISLWRRSVPLQAAGIRMRSLSPDDLLFHLCIHATANHGCRVPLRSIYDIALVVGARNPASSWAGFLQQAERAGASRPVLCGLRLAEELFQARVPEAVFTALTPAMEFDLLRGHAMFQIRTFTREAVPPLMDIIHQDPFKKAVTRLIGRAVSLATLPQIPREESAHEGPILTRLRHHARVVAGQLRYAGRLLISPAFAKQQWKAARVQTQLRKWMIPVDGGRPPAGTPSDK